MPALWQSSQKPMYVRTVWVDGFRHAILTPDDPYYTRNKRRPHSSASTTKYTLRNSRGRDEEPRKLSLVIRSDKSKIVSKPRPKSEPIEQLNLKELDLESEEDFVLKANPQPIYECDTGRSNYDSLSTNMRAFKTNGTARNETKENTDLSDRVLQWLDLAGKIDLLAPAAERMSQPRHSWPEIQKRNNLCKSKTTVDLRVKEEVKSPKTDSARTCIDYQVPPSAATIETYARQSRNKITPREKRDKNKRDIRVNVLEARQKVVTERNAVEKQYAELVSKKLIPDLGKGKKQVHIFMPEMIKKNSNSRTESLLSTLS